jgi:hypothetical protein
MAEKLRSLIEHNPLGRSVSHAILEGTLATLTAASDETATANKANCSSRTPVHESQLSLQYFIAANTIQANVQNISSRTQSIDRSPRTNGIRLAKRIIARGTYRKRMRVLGTFVSEMSLPSGPDFSKSAPVARNRV